MDSEINQRHKSTTILRPFLVRLNILNMELSLTEKIESYIKQIFICKLNVTDYKVARQTSAGATSEQ